MKGNATLSIGGHSFELVGDVELGAPPEPAFTVTADFASGLSLTRHMDEEEGRRLWQWARAIDLRRTLKPLRRSLLASSAVGLPLSIPPAALPGPFEIIVPMHMRDYLHGDLPVGFKWDNRRW